MKWMLRGYLLSFIRFLIYRYVFYICEAENAWFAAMFKRVLSEPAAQVFASASFVLFPAVITHPSPTPNYIPMDPPLPFVLAFCLFALCLFVLCLFALCPFALCLFALILFALCLFALGLFAACLFAWCLFTLSLHVFVRLVLPLCLSAFWLSAWYLKRVFALQLRIHAFTIWKLLCQL